MRLCKVKQRKWAYIGVVIQNESGEVAAALAKVLPLVDDPTAAEAISAWFALKLCVDCGFQQVVLEGDSMTVVSALNQASPNWSSYGQLIERRNNSVGSKCASGGNKIC